MLVGNKIQGTAGTALKNRALASLNWTATQSAIVNDMLTRQDILLMVMVAPGVGDQTTLVEWKNNKTRISVTVYANQQDPALQLEADLLHELVLHAEPAAEKHLAAVNNQVAPVYPTTDTDIEEEEEAEHGAVDRWRRAAVIAHAQSMALMERVISDAASHDTTMATTVLQQLKETEVITAEQAEELQEDLVDV